jgi:hypothetical protein
VTTYYVSQEDCDTEDTHLVETDDDGYCVNCGHQ